MHSLFGRYWRSAWTLRSSITRNRVIRLSSASAFIIRPPSRVAPREVPTPLVFVSASTWDEDSSKGITELSSMLAEKGFTCVQTDLKIPDSVLSTEMMQKFEAELKSAINYSMIPFPPVIFARSKACLIAQTYISSHPATGLVLISPPASNADIDERWLPARLPEFDFEPQFPIAVLGTSQETKALQKAHRLCQAQNVDVITVDNVDGKQMFAKIEEWLDELGI
ncbi:hypothetical protein BDQ12DRAFT_418811 [Crucibulum laeve]|uniref:Uncharacterized protein n=1 Tax=Crucibulum laeve TaxID=68775 RepID=A0A5C3M6D9_9AGAR|nr:hypothetical protein BDQ12DRAFT_418811 [Crucibulum laeve]